MFDLTATVTKYVRDVPTCWQVTSVDFHLEAMGHGWQTNLETKQKRRSTGANINPASEGGDGVEGGQGWIELLEH